MTITRFGSSIVKSVSTLVNMRNQRGSVDSVVVLCQMLLSKQKAHAISESLGNKGLICREECDDCNQRFNQTIEQDVTRFFQFFLILNGVKGKNGSPTLQGNGISITNNPSSRSTLGRDTLVLKVKTMPDTRDIQEITKFVSDQFSFSNVKYVPQNIYKCFCKYVLSLLDNKYLQYFKETINWINEPLSFSPSSACLALLRFSQL